MTNGVFRAAVIGVGSHGRNHARILAAMPNVELVGIVDRDPDRAHAVAASVGAPVVDDIHAINPPVDGVVVAVPTADHAEVAAPLLEAGIAVLIEKPIATSLAEADRLLALADAAGATLAVGHTERHNPAVAAALPLISTPRFIEVHRLAAFQPRSLDVDVILDVMIHDIDILLAIVGDEPASIEAVGVPVLSGRIDIANVRLRFPDGCIANLTASRISRERVRKLRVFQPHALVSVDYAERQVEAVTVTRPPAGEPKIDVRRVEVADAEPLERELADFVRSVRTGEAPGVTGADGRRALAVAHRIADFLQTDAAVGSEEAPA